MALASRKAKTACYEESEWSHRRMSLTLIAMSYIQHVGLYIKKLYLCKTFMHTCLVAGKKIDRTDWKESACETNSVSYYDHLVLKYFHRYDNLQHVHLSVQMK